MESLCSEQVRRFGVPKLDGLLAPPSEKNAQQKRHQFKGIPLLQGLHTHTHASHKGRREELRRGLMCMCARSKDKKMKT